MHLLTHLFVIGAMLGGGGTRPARAAGMSQRPLADPTPGVGSAPPLFDLAFWPHAAVTASMFATTALLQAVVASGLGAGLGCRHDLGADSCSPHGLFAVDAVALGDSSAAWRGTSDGLQVLSVAGPVAAALIEHGLLARPRRWDEAGQDILVELESVALASLLATTLKFAVRRPRPGAYGAPPTGAAAELSFPSGHVTAAAAGMTAYATTFALRHGHARGLAWVMGAAVALTGLTAAGRVLGGMHFPTDVVGGGLLGAGVGLLVPYLARHQIGLRPYVADQMPDRQEVFGGLALTWRSP